MTSCKSVGKWQLWLARLHFMDKPQISKRRPVLVIDVDGNEATVVKITSHEPRDEPGEYAIIEWREAGLLKPSTIRTSQIFRLSLNDLERDAPLGILQTHDKEALSAILLAMGVFE
jgi:hypothetical protein